MTNEFLKAVENRRTVYALGKDTNVSQERIVEIVEHALKHSPTAFNSQGNRLLVLFGDHHNKLWDITKDILKGIVPAENFPATEERINAFRNAYGTVLFFEDYSVVEALQQQYALYKDNFPVWSSQSAGMLQFVVWTALEAEGLGANLQHYNPLINEAVAKEWGVPSNWKLVGQLNFGAVLAKPDEKQFQPLDDKIKVFK